MSHVVYFSARARVVALSPREAAVRLPNGEAVLVTPEVARAIEFCRQPRPRDEHITAIHEATGASVSRTAVERVFQNLVEVGVMEAVTAQRAPASSRRIERILVRACDRPRALDALLQSLPTREFEGRTIVVVDDSATSVNAEPIAGGRARGLAIEHVDAARRARLIEALSSSHDATLAVPVERGGERRHGGGKALNLAILLGAGRPFALIDEDFLFPFRTLGDAGTSSMCTRIHADRAQALAAGTDVADPFALHERVCGATLDELRGDPALAADAIAIAAERVVATANGHRGATCGSGAYVVLWRSLDRASRDHLDADEATFRRVVADPPVWFARGRHTLVETANLLPFALDGRALIPPTLPFGRAQDFALGAALRAVHPTAAVLETAWAIGHDQPDVRDKSADFERPAAPLTSECLARCLRDALAPCAETDPGARLRFGAARLLDLACEPESMRIERLRDAIFDVRANWVRTLHAARAEVRAPFRLAWIDRMLALNRQALTRPGAPRLFDWPEGLDPQGCARQFADDLERYGRLLDAWPALYAAARSADLLGRD